MDETRRRNHFEKICKDIKSVKIQGAESVAIAGLKAYSLLPSKSSIRKLLSLRATEPALKNALSYAEKEGIGLALKHFVDSERKTDELILKLIKNKSSIYTHCHSSTVVRGLMYAKLAGRRFTVMNTETRPLFQGRKTAKDLAEAGIKVITTIDSAARENILESDFMIIGADAILADGSVINKIGSGLFAQIAHDLKKKVYVATDSWKFSKENVKIEERNYKEIWNKAPKEVKVQNPAFEKVESEYITGIISELGILKPKDFVKKVKKSYKF